MESSGGRLKVVGILKFQGDMPTFDGKNAEFQRGQCKIKSRKFQGGHGKIDRKSIGYNIKTIDILNIGGVHTLFLEDPNKTNLDNSVVNCGIRRCESYVVKLNTN